MEKDSKVLDKKVFENGMLRLEAAFRHQPLTEESLKVYYEFLKKFSNEDFQSAVEICIRNETFFPSINYFIKSIGEKPRYLTPEKIAELNS